MTEHKRGFSADPTDDPPPTKPPEKPPPPLGQQVLPDEAIKYVKLLRVKPMDVVIIKTAMRLTLQEQTQIMRGLRAVLPANVGALILDSDFDVEVIRPES